MPHPSYDKAVRDGQKKDKSLRQKVTDWIAPYEKATSDFFGNPLENLEKNYKPKAREFDKYKKKNKKNKKNKK